MNICKLRLIEYYNERAIHHANQSDHFMRLAAIQQEPKENHDFGDLNPELDGDL